MGKKSAQRLRAVAKKAANAVAEARKKEREDAPAAAPAVTATTPKARTRINSNAIMGMPSPFPPSDGSTIAAAIVVDDGSSDSDDVQEVRDERILPQKQEPAHQQVTAGRKCRHLFILFLLAPACAYFKNTFYVSKNRAMPSGERCNPRRSTATPKPAVAKDPHPSSSSLHALILGLLYQ